MRHKTKKNSSDVNKRYAMRHKTKKNSSDVPETFSSHSDPAAARGSAPNDGEVPQASKSNKKEGFIDGFCGMLEPEFDKPDTSTPSVSDASPKTTREDISALLRRPAPLPGLANSRKTTGSAPNGGEVPPKSNTKDRSTDRQRRFAEPYSDKSDVSTPADAQSPRRQEKEGLSGFMSRFFESKEDDQRPARKAAGLRPESDGTWAVSLCGCCSDCCACMEVCYCFPCQVAKQYHLVTYNQVGCDCPLSYLMCCCPIVLLCFGCSTRHRTRERYVIESTKCNDCMATCYCPCCSHIQILRQMTYMKEFPGACCYSADDSAAPK